jgi:uncharacterized protein (TIGR02996 family)
MNPEFQGLMADIVRNPADDTPRLILADWLADHGQEKRGAAIRYALWVARANAGDPSGEPPSSHWNDDYNSLLVRFPRWSFGCSRGFVSYVRCDLQDWLAHGPAIAAAHPVDRVELSDRKAFHARNNIPPAEVGYGWRRESRLAVEDWPATIPAPIWDALPPSTRDPRSKLWRLYAAEAEADDALSAACILWARQPAAKRL